jgi:hypothetical protein
VTSTFGTCTHVVTLEEATFGTDGHAVSDWVEREFVCGEPAVVKLNREPLCLEHYDAALGDVAGMIRRAAEVDAAERLAIVRDEDCPQCGWPETYAEGPEDGRPDVIGCRKCGWEESIA